MTTLVETKTGSGANKPSTKPQTIDELFEALVAVHPDAPAIHTPLGPITLANLHADVLRLAHFLTKEGAAAGSRVALFADRSYEQVVALLALSKISATYVPLDPLLPKAKLMEMVELTTPEILLTSSSVAPSILNEEMKSFSIRDIIASSSAPEEMTHTPPSPKTPLYCTFTSSGKLAVELTHQSISALIPWYKETFDLSSEDIAAITSKPSQDMSIAEILVYLLSGVQIKIPTRQVLQNPEELKKWIISEKITLIHLPTSSCELMIDENWEDPSLGTCQLRTLFTGGETLKKRVRADLPFEVVNCYGPAENGVLSLYHRVSESSSVPPPIGQPLPFVKVLLLSESLQEVEEGEEGMLALSSPALAEGYLGADEEKKKNFIIYSKLGKRPERYFLTDDTVKKLENGEYQFIGRKDKQVTIGDECLQLDQIETLLVNHPSVLQAAVKEVSPGMLAAYYVVKKDLLVTKQALVKLLKSNLPKHAVPSFLIELSQLPLNHHMKVLYDQLPNPPKEECEEEIYFPPKNATERELTLICQEHLGIYPISTKKNLFEFPYSVVSLAKIVSGIDKRLHRKINITTLYEHPTVAELAEYLKEPQDESLLADIREGGDGMPLICFGGIDGELYPFFELGKHFSDKHALYGVKMETIERHPDVIKRAEEVDKELSRTLRTEEVALLGYGFGGILAFEVARLLKKRGIHIRTLALVDAPSPKKTFLLLRPFYSLKTFFKKIYKRSDEPFLMRYQRFEERLLRTIGLSSADEKLQEKVTQRFSREMKTPKKSYHPSPLDIDVVLFEAEELENERKEIAEGWKAFVPRLSIKLLPTRHEKLFESSSLTFLAQSIARLLS